MSPNSRSLASRLCSSVSTHRSIRCKSAWVDGKKPDIYVFVLYSAQRLLWLLVNASCWGLNHTSAKCEFYQIIRVLNHCLPTIVLTEECERGNKLLHGEWERVCARVCARVRDRFCGDLRCHRAANHNLHYSFPTSQHEHLQYYEC